MPSPDVVFALTGDVRRNSRALKQLRALAALGCNVEALTFGPPAAAPAFEKRIRLRVLPRPPGRGLLFFWRVHRLFRQAAQERPARVYHASDLYTLPAMYAAAHQHDARVAYDARELYPHVAATTGRPWVRIVWQLIEGRYAHRADAIFTVSDSIASRIAQTYDVPRPIVLHNVPPYQVVEPTNALRVCTECPDGVVILLHQGSMQQHRGCALLIDAMRNVQGSVLVFLGNGPLKASLVRQAADLGLQQRVLFVDPVPPDALLPVTASADIGITMLEDTCLNHRFALPNKLFEYLMAGLPVLASDLPELRTVVATHDVGLLVDPSDRPALIAALQRMVDDAHAREQWAQHAPHVFETFNWERASERFKHVYVNLLGHTPVS